MRLGRANALVAGVVVVVWGLITHGTFAGSGDEPHYMMIAHSLGFDRDVDLANNYADATLIGGGTLEAGAHAVRREGALIPVHDIGMPAAFAPFIVAAYLLATWLAAALPESVLDATKLNASLMLRHQVSLMMALLTGLLAREMYWLLLDISGRERRAFWWSLLFALTPPLLSHSFLFFTEIPSALLTLVALRRLLKRDPTAIDTGIAGAAAGALLLVHIRNIGLVAGLVLMAMHARKTWRPRPLAWGVALLATFVVLRGIVTYALWGSLVTTPHARLAESWAIGPVLGEAWTRASGLLLDREFGLIAYAPIYLLAAPGALLLRRYVPTTVLWPAGLYLLFVVLVVTNVHGWTGGWSPAARMVLPIAPILWLCVYAASLHAPALVLYPLLGLQVVINAYLWQFPKLMWADGDGVAAYWAASWLPTWTQASHVAWFVVLAVCIAAYALATVRWVRALPREPRGEHATGS